MKTKTILLTGATDGIGLKTAEMLAAEGRTLLLHGRNSVKLEEVRSALAGLPNTGPVATYTADLSRLRDVEAMARAVSEQHDRIDVLINNAGVYVVPERVSPDGLDVRFAVNTIAPYLLTKRLLPLMDSAGRVVNLSSAAQTPLNPEELATPSPNPDGMVYARSKLALTMWSRAMALSLAGNGPAIIAVNPRSFLGSKMVKEAYGREGFDLRIGADILCRAALSEEFAHASGKYFDNDVERFTSPHPDALNESKCNKVVDVIEAVLEKKAEL